MYRYFSLYALLERNKCFGGNDSRNGLHLVVEQVHELFVVACIQLHKHGVRTCGEVTFHYLGYVDKTLYDILVHASAFEVQSDVCACGISDALRIDIESAACYHSVFYEMLYALVYGGS